MIAHPGAGFVLFSLAGAIALWLAFGRRRSAMVGISVCVIGAVAYGLAVLWALRRKERRIVGNERKGTLRYERRCESGATGQYR